MTQTNLEIDRFAIARVVVAARIDVSAYRAAVEIGERLEFIRRSIGQKTRWAIARAAK